jgi:hypothetical protein
LFAEHFCTGQALRIESLIETIELLAFGFWLKELNETVERYCFIVDTYQQRIRFLKRLKTSYD